MADFGLELITLTKAIKEYESLLSIAKGAASRFSTS